METASVACHDDIKKWVDKNRGAFMMLVWRLLHCDVDAECLLSTHVAMLTANYDGIKRAVEVTSHEVVEIDVADQFANEEPPSLSALHTASDYTSLRCMYSSPYPDSSGEIFSVLLVILATPAGKMLRRIPLGCEPNVALFMQSTRLLHKTEGGAVQVENLLDCLNTGRAGLGSCGSKADKVSAAALAGEFADKPEEMQFNNARLAAIRTGLGEHMTELIMFTLLLGSKKHSLRKSHRVRIVLEYNTQMKASVVRKCEAIPIDKLVDGCRKYMPIVPCESQAGLFGKSVKDSWEDTLRGTTAEISSQAALRESVYLPTIVVEFSEKSRQFVLPMFLANVEVKKMEAYRLSPEGHKGLLLKKLQSLQCIP